ncbi:alpha/beta fold hydrolase [Nocardia aurantiaca]|uniref:Alpha/beta fold hydrolase n=1 Tax=Nocardia aurantiaca TaxID=2675850 RepID=A0A6I3KZU3_9NOCA|nr:alpha/beta hydrolase [Nocardia aurantiaca]MTE16243.1 alpha/beta fold hydrolase [Nocardia aurantiaca]
MTQTTMPPRIAVDKIGDGEPALLFLPGWCDFRSLFRDLLPLTGRHRTSVSLDWRGHGGSDRALVDFGAIELADDAQRVIEDLGLARVIPIGQAHAGWIALELRRRLGPERVPGVVFLDWMVLGPPPGFLDALVGLQNLAASEGVRAALMEMWTRGIDSPAVHAHVARMSTHGFDMWARAGREIAAGFAANGSPVAALEALACPALHVYAQPTDDEFLSAQKAYAAAHPSFHVQRLDASSHFPVLEVPGEIATAIEAFAGEVEAID